MNTNFWCLRWCLGAVSSLVAAFKTASSKVKEALFAYLLFVSIRVHLWLANSEGRAPASRGVISLLSNDGTRKIRVHPWF